MRIKQFNSMRQMPRGSSKFNVQEFKLILRPVPAVPNVPPVKASRQFKGQRFNVQ
jgi:hypothetical protein